MSVKLGNITTNSAVTTTTISVQHTVADNPNRLLIIGIHIADTTQGDRPVLSVTYNGVSATRAGLADNNPGGIRTELWYLLAPDVGTANVVVTTTGVVNDLIVGVQDVYNMVQTAPEATDTSTANTDTVTNTVTTISGYAYLFQVSTFNSTGNVTHGVDQIELYDITSAGGDQGSASYESIPTAGLHTHTATLTGANRNAGVMAAFVSIHEINVNDVVTVAEDVSVAVDAPLTVFDSITIAESVSVYLDVLNINVFEFSGLLITEHVDVIDLVVEVGAVADFVSVTEFAQAYPDSFYVSAYDDVLSTEFAYLYLDTLFVTAIDDAFVAEFLFLYIDVLNIFPADELAVVENASITLDALYTSVFENTSVEESVSVYLDAINISVYEFSGLLITEHIDVIDLVVEVGVVAEFISVLGFASLFLDTLNISVDDAVAVTEYAFILDIIVELSAVDIVGVTDFADALLPELYTAVFDTATITEAVSVLDIIVEVGIVFDEISVDESVSASLSVIFAIAGDDITIAEDSSVTLPTLNISADDGVSIIEAVQLLDIVIELGVVFDDINISEDISLELSDFSLNVWDDIVVDEFTDVLDIIIEMSGYDEIYVASDTEEGPPILDIYLDVLNFSVLDPSHVLITEHVDVLDIVVEVGAVDDNISVLEFAVASLDALFISAVDNITIEEAFSFIYSAPLVIAVENISTEENISVFIDQLFVAVDAPVSVQDFAILTDIIIELGPVIENISVVDLGEPVLGELLISVNEGLNIDEWAVAFNPTIELFVTEEEIGVWSDTLEGPPSAVLVLDVLYPSVYEQILITESVSVLDLTIEVGIAVDNVAVQEVPLVSLGALVLYVDDTIEVMDYIDVFDEALGVGPVWDDITAGEDINISLDVLNVFGLSEVSVLDYGTAFDPVIELFASDDIGVTEVVITPFGVIVGEDSYVNGALFHNISVQDWAYLVVPYLFVSVADDVAIEEWVLVFDIIIELGPAIDDISVSEYLPAPALSFDIFIWDEVTYTEYSIAGYPLNIDVADDILIIEYSLILKQAYDLYPRIHNVCPRRRIFIRNKRKVRL